MAKDFNFLKTLRKYRLDYDFKYSDMANCLNISKAYYWQIENKERRLTYDMAIQISNFFNKTPDELFYNDLKN